MVMTAPIIWSTGQCPASAAARHLSSRFALAIAPARTIGAELAAKTAARTTAETAAGTTRASRTTPSSAWPAAPIAATRPTAPVAIAAVLELLLALRPRHQVHEVEELAALLSALGSRLALDHPHQSNLADLAANHVQRLHQAREAVALELHGCTHRLRFRPLAQRWLRRCGRSITRRVLTGRRRGSGFIARGGGVIPGGRHV
jgi:hypothetical protein